MRTGEQAPPSASGPRRSGPEAPGKSRAEVWTENFFDLLGDVSVILVAALLAFVFLARISVVVGESMEDTLKNGDRVVVSRLFYTPKYGDIVLFRKESFKNAAIVKRVIATEGQTVDIDFLSGVVYVDGVALYEPYAKAPTYEPESFDGAVTVPAGCVFVLGDNRNNSTDSRYSLIGCVDTRCIIGKALFRASPLNQFGNIYQKTGGRLLTPSLAAETEP